MTIEPAAPGRPPSIRDVARVAGVSHQTVSRVLNNHPSIRDTTRQRVLDVMTELQYQPNRAARALASSRSRTIGILSAMSTDYGPASIMASVESAARANGYWVSIANIDPTVEGSIRTRSRSCAPRRSRASWWWPRRYACSRRSRSCLSTSRM